MARSLRRGLGSGLESRQDLFGQNLDPPVPGIRRLARQFGPEVDVLNLRIPLDQAGELVERKAPRVLIYFGGANAYFDALDKSVDAGFPELAFEPAGA